MKVEIYSKTGCPYCVAAKQFLQSHSIPFTEYVLDDDAERQAFYARVGATTVPQIFFSGERIGGYQELRKLDLSSYQVGFNEEF